MPSAFAYGYLYIHLLHARARGRGREKGTDGHVLRTQNATSTTSQRYNLSSGVNLPARIFVWQWQRRSAAQTAPHVRHTYTHSHTLHIN